MSSVSVLSTSSFRTAARPSTYIHLVARNYSGLTVAKLGSSQFIHAHNSPFAYTPMRLISSTPQNQIKEFFPPPQTSGVKEVESAWAHPV